MLQFKTSRCPSNVALPRPALYLTTMGLGIAENIQCESEVLAELNGDEKLVTNNDMEPAPGFVTGTPSL